ncbi:hypothetical protein ACFWOI_34865, partial [Streptomyces sp. NPDC058424]
LGRVPLARVALLAHYLELLPPGPSVPVSGCPGSGGNFIAHLTRSHSHEAGDKAVHHIEHLRLGVRDLD